MPLVPLVAALALGISLYVASFFLRALAEAVAQIPVVGGPLASAIGAVENAIDGLIRAAYQGVEGALSWFLYELFDAGGWLLDALGRFSVNLGEWLQWLVLEKIPELIRAGVNDLVQLASWAADLGRWLLARLNDLEQWVAGLRDWLLGELYRLAVWPLQHLWADVILPLWSKVEWLVGEGWHYLVGAIEAIGYRIGQAEDWIFNEGKWLAETVARDLNPLRVTEWVIGELWRLVPDGLKLFLAWLWHLLVEFGELLGALVDPSQWPELERSFIRFVVGQMEAEADALGQLLRDQLIGKDGG